MIECDYHKIAIKRTLKQDKRCASPAFLPQYFKIIVIFLNVLLPLFIAKQLFGGNFFAYALHFIFPRTLIGV